MDASLLQLIINFYLYENTWYLLLTYVELGVDSYQIIGDSL